MSSVGVMYRSSSPNIGSNGGRRGLMVMALDCGVGGHEFKPRRFQNIFDFMEWFDGEDKTV